MFKHIIGQSIYQFLVLLVLLFYGENFLPEYEDSFDAQLIKDNTPMSYKYNYINGNCNIIWRIVIIKTNSRLCQKREIY